jgi:hypothetical protein
MVSERDGEALVPSIQIDLGPEFMYDEGLKPVVVVAAAIGFLGGSCYAPFCFCLMYCHFS